MDIRSIDQVAFWKGVVAVLTGILVVMLVVTLVAP